jgi:hypothetical protein
MIQPRREQRMRCPNLAGQTRIDERKKSQTLCYEITNTSCAGKHLDPPFRLRDFAICYSLAQC